MMVFRPMHFPRNDSVFSSVSARKVVSHVVLKAVRLKRCGTYAGFNDFTNNMKAQCSILTKGILQSPLSGAWNPMRACQKQQQPPPLSLARGLTHAHICPAHALLPLRCALLLVVILQEAHEKANELRVKTEHDFNLEKQTLVHNAKQKGA